MGRGIEHNLGVTPSSLLPGLTCLSLLISLPSSSEKCSPTLVKSSNQASQNHKTALSRGKFALNDLLGISPLVHAKVI